MRCVTWSRDSHGLFDYESKNIAKKNIKNADLLEDNMIVYLGCLIKNGRVDEAHDILNDHSTLICYAEPLRKRQEYYEIKAEIMEKLKN